MQYTLVATAKNEGPYLLEWVAFHKMIGFNHILMFQNGSDDGTSRILRCLDDMGVVTFRNNPARAGMHQLKAYRRAATFDAFRKADWAIALDIDEFLNIHVGDGSLDDLVNALPEADEVLLNWRRFGWNGHKTLSHDLVSARFTAAETVEFVQHQLVAYKTMFRPACFDRAGIHRPNTPLVPAESIRSCNGSGLRLGEFQRHNYRSTDPGGRALAQVNHYIVRDAASFVLKSARGSAHQANRQISRRYWRNRNCNATQDLSLASRSQGIAEAMAELDAQSGGRLSRLRRRAIRHHRALFRECLKTDIYRDLYDYCLSWQSELAA